MYLFVCKRLQIALRTLLKFVEILLYLLFFKLSWKRICRFPSSPSSYFTSPTTTFPCVRCYERRWGQTIRPSVLKHQVAKRPKCQLVGEEKWNNNHRYQLYNSNERTLNGVSTSFPLLHLLFLLPLCLWSSHLSPLGLCHSDFGGIIFMRGSSNWIKLVPECSNLYYNIPLLLILFLIN